MPFARQSFANRLKAIVDFGLTPFYPGYDFDKWDRRMRLPMPKTPSLSIEDAQWRAEHAAQMARADEGPETAPSRPARELA